MAEEKIGITDEQADRYAPILAGMKKYFEDKDVHGQLSKLIEAQLEQSVRIKDMTARVQGLEQTVRNFLDYVQTERAGANARGQSQITQQTSPRAQVSGLSKESLDSIPWQTNKRGEWTYSRSRDGSDSTDPTVQELVYLLTEKSPLDLYGMEYSLSGNDGMFIGRVKAGSSPPRSGFGRGRAY